MMERILGSKAKIKILRALEAEPNLELCLEDVARAAGIALGTAHPAVKDLAAARILLTRRVGRSTLYKINGSHLLRTQIKDLFLRENSAYRNVAEKFSVEIDKTGVESVVLFGSVARGDYTCVGDIDMLIITRDGSMPPGTDRLVQDFLDRYDTIISPMAISAAELKARMKKFDGLILKVAEEGKLLYGEAKWLGT